MKRLLAIAVAATAMLANAQTFPGSKPISIVVPFAAGGPTDLVARQLGEAMRKAMGGSANFVVENAAGAGGTIGATKVARAAPDGHTLLLFHIGMASTPALYKKIAYKPLEDFEFLGMVNEVPMTLIGKPQLPANTYVLKVKEMEAARGDIRPNMLLVMHPQGAAIELPGEETVEPTFGLAAMWVGQGLREEATFKGLTVVDPATVVTTHLTEIVKDNLAEMLSFAETQKLLAELDAQYQKLLADLVPQRLSTAGIQRVLQGLLAERVSIRRKGAAGS